MKDPLDKVYAPWTEDQIASLKGYQESPFHHPFTGLFSETILIPTVDGWYDPSNGAVMQLWAFRFMTDWTWKS